MKSESIYFSGIKTPAVTIR